MSAEQLQNQMAVMQQQFAAEKQQMAEQMQRMAQENSHLQVRIQTAASSPSPGVLSQASSAPTVTAPRIDMRLMQPSPFHGTASSNARQWLLEVERYFLATNVATDEKRILYASTFLRDTASMWYFTISEELSASHAPSWAEFKTRFLSRFQPIAASKVARAQLRLLKQRNRVAGYSHEFLRLTHLIPDMSLADQLESYMVGLHQDLAIEVEKKEPTTLLEAMEFAQRIELMTTGRRQAYGRLPGGYNFARSSSSSSSTSSYNNYHGGSSASNGSSDRMDLSAIRSADEDSDFMYGDEVPRPSSSMDTTLLSAAVEQVLKLNGMFQRGRSGPGGMNQRGGRQGGGGFNYSKYGLSKDDFERLMKEGKCFKCKGTGHQARFCNVKPKN